MSAERLREAARVLWERAESVQVAIDDWDATGRAYVDARAALTQVGFADAGDHGPVAVALAVAYWLDSEAEMVEASRLSITFDGHPMRPASGAAIKVADAILGGAA